MKAKYKKQAPLLWMLFGLIMIILGTMGTHIPQWAITILVILASATIVVAGTISIIREKPDK